MSLAVGAERWNEPDAVRMIVTTDEIFRRALLEQLHGQRRWNNKRSRMTYGLWFDDFISSLDPRPRRHRR